MKVLKFGGTSVGSWENILKVKDIVLSQNEQVVVVVSALSGVTDKLIAMAKSAEKGDSTCFDIFDEIKQKHQTVYDNLFKSSQKEEVELKTAILFDELLTLVKGVYMLKELTNKSFENISSFGERISSLVISYAISESNLFDSKQYIKTDLVFGRNQVDSELTYSNLQAIKNSLGKISIFPGFISSNKQNESTTLGRGGSDYTAAILAAAFDASLLEIWTDVDGFMTADPRVIRHAHCIDKLTYSEAMELSHFGAKVIYPPTILPVFKKGIPILIKNTFNTQAVGTLISSEPDRSTSRVIKGISSISNVSLLTIQGIGMVGVTGISMRLFKSLATKDINVILISQASSENSISIVIETAVTETAVTAIEAEFANEIKLNLINKMSVEPEMAVMAIVGENMKNSTGISGKLFNSLGTNGINISAIAQGASELNISFVVKERELKKALNVLHDSFFLSNFTMLNVTLVGIGTVGAKLLSQISQQNEKLMKENKVNIRIVGLASSKKMIFDAKGLDYSDPRALLNEHGATSNMKALVTKIEELNLPNSIVVDCTANEDVASIYLELLQNNISVVTANKIASSSEYVKYKQLKDTARAKGVKFLYETNVGAGLPIISPLNDLVRSGDHVIKLEAVLSGTLNFIVNNISAEKPLSKVIVEAKEKGFSEPDPRIDLSGLDVARKLLILSREAGEKMESSDIKVTPFIPQEYIESGSIENFLEKVKELDPIFEKERQRLEREGKRWRYAARFEEGKANLSLIEVDSKHPFYDLEGSNNIILITSKNYREHPMQIKGYGAGADVTAAGVFADIIKVANI